MHIRYCPFLLSMREQREAFCGSVSGLDRAIVWKKGSEVDFRCRTRSPCPGHQCCLSISTKTFIMEESVYALTRRFILLKQSAAWHESLRTDGSEAAAVAAASAAKQESLELCQHKFSAFLDHFQPTVASKGPAGGDDEAGGAARVSYSSSMKRYQALPPQSRKRSREECFREASHALSAPTAADSAQAVRHGTMFSSDPSQGAGDSLRSADQVLLRTIGETESFFVVLDTSSSCLPIARTSPACEQWTGTAVQYVNCLICDHFPSFSQDTRHRICRASACISCTANAPTQSLYS